MDPSSHVLDDVAWHALSGPQEHLAVVGRGGTVRRYDADVGPFCGVERLDAAAWAPLGELVGIGGVAVFLRGQVEPAPAGWTELLREPATQYVAGLDCGASTRPVGPRSSSSARPTRPTWSG